MKIYVKASVGSGTKRQLESSLKKDYEKRKKTLFIETLKVPERLTHSRD